MGTIGRQSGQVRLHMLNRTTKVEVQGQLAKQRVMDKPQGTCSWSIKRKPIVSAWSYLRCSSMRPIIRYFSRIRRFIQLDEQTRQAYLYDSSPHLGVRSGAP